MSLSLFSTSRYLEDWLNKSTFFTDVIRRVKSKYFHLRTNLNTLKKLRLLYGDKEGRVSFLNLESGACTHLLPALRLGMDRYWSSYIIIIISSPMARWFCRCNYHIIIFHHHRHHSHHHPPHHHCRYRRALRWHDGSVDAIVFRPAEGIIVTGSEDRFMKVGEWIENELKI